MDGHKIGFSEGQLQGNHTGFIEGHHIGFVNGQPLNTLETHQSLSTLLMRKKFEMECLCFGRFYGTSNICGMHPVHAMLHLQAKPSAEPASESLQPQSWRRARWR